MTLSMSLGVSVGVRRALWMMLGELVGVALVGAAALGGGSGTFIERAASIYGRKGNWRCLFNLVCGQSMALASKDCIEPSVG